MYLLALKQFEILEKETSIVRVQFYSILYIKYYLLMVKKILIFVINKRLLLFFFKYRIIYLKKSQFKSSLIRTYFVNY